MRTFLVFILIFAAARANANLKKCDYERIKTVSEQLLNRYFSVMFQFELQRKKLPYFPESVITKTNSYSPKNGTICLSIEAQAISDGLDLYSETKSHQNKSSPCKKLKDLYVLNFKTRTVFDKSGNISTKYCVGIVSVNSVKLEKNKYLTPSLRLIDRISGKNYGTLKMAHQAKFVLFNEKMQ